MIEPLTKDTKLSTLPFAGIARAAFIAIQLKSFVTEKIISENDYDDVKFIKYRIKQMSTDLNILSKKVLDNTVI